MSLYAYVTDALSPARYQQHQLSAVFANVTCSELISTVVPNVCSSNFIDALARERERLGETAEAAVEFTSTASYWQIAAGTLVGGSILINHGRFIAWIGLSLSLLSMQLLYVGWQLTMIAVTMVMYQAGS